MLFSAVQAHHLHLAKLCHRKKDVLNKKPSFIADGEKVIKTQFSETFLGLFVQKWKILCLKVCVFKGNTAFFLFLLDKTEMLICIYHSRKQLCSLCYLTLELQDFCQAELLL